MTEEKILVTVRTYPTISGQYVETVCTGGITDSGEWRRLYPVALRYLLEQQQYRTYDVIKVKVREGADGRAETRRPDNQSICVVDHLKEWTTRDQWIRPTIFCSLQELIDAGRSIGPVAVDRVLDLEATFTSEDWSEAEKQKLKQQQLFGERLPIEKVPYDFRFVWRDADGQEHRCLAIDWEMKQAWRNYRHLYPDPVEQMRRKWLDDLCGSGRQLAFYMGNHRRFRQNFMVCGLYNPPLKEISDSDTLF